MILFDFDKTLIDKDTLFGFYKTVHGDNTLFKFKRLIIILVAIIYKLKIINNTRLKKIGITLFLNGKTQAEIEEKAEVYVKGLKLNSIYHDIFLSCPQEKRLIISASPEIYLKKMFPNENVLGTILNFDHKEVKLKLNCYKDGKVLRYNEKYSNIPIDSVYSDSYSDMPLFKKSKDYHIIEKSSIKASYTN